MKTIVMRGSGWSSGPVVKANSPFRRWRGLRGRPSNESLLIRTRSVHGFGMNRSFVGVGLTRELRVKICQVVRPGTVARFQRCRYVLEIPVGAPLPKTGTQLVVSDV